MKREYLKDRKIVETYFTKEPIKLREIRDILNKLPDDYALISVKEKLVFDGFHENSSSTYLPIIEIRVDDENKEINFYVSKK